MFAVTTAASDRALLTPAEARAAIGKADAPDELITPLIARVSASIVRACRVPAAGATPPTLRLETVSDTFRLKSDQGVLILSRKPIVSIVSVVENDETLDADEYEANAAAGLLKRLSDDNEVCWPSGKIVVAYSAGWETVPEELKQAAAMLARAYHFEGARVPGLRSMEIPGLISESYQDKDADNPNIPNEVMELLYQGGFVHHMI